MKKQISTLLIVLILCSFSFACVAQDEQQSYTRAMPKWVSKKGNWVIESNTKTPENSIIYFYNNENVLVYKEKIEGMKINLKKRKVLMKLKNALEQSVITWEKQHILKEDGMIVATALKR